MAESSVSEHGFNLKDAEHERGTNRYVFRYPETWYNSQAFADLTVGLRSIILKPDPLDVNLSALQIVKVANNESVAPYLHINYDDKGTVVDAYGRRLINGDIAFPDRMPIRVNVEINEGIKMGDICDNLTDECNEDIDYYSKQYDRVKAEFDSNFATTEGKSLETFKIFYGCVDFQYNRDRQFIMSTTNPENYKFMVVRKQTVVGTSSQIKTTPQEPTQLQSTETIECFGDDFEMLLSLRFDGQTSLNRILAGLAGIDKDYKIEQAKADCDKYGISFIGVQTLNYPIQPEYQYVDKKYDITKPVNTNTYAQAIIFTGLVVNQVWSRKDLLIKSSIAELDVNNYLGYSTMTTSSPVCIYASPKMYPIESQSFKFWVDLYDSYNDDLVELPDNVVMIIEAALYLKPKIPFNRY